MSEGNWGIIVTESYKRYFTLTFASGEIINDIRKGLEGEGLARKYGMNYVAGRAGIPDDKIDELSKKVCETVDEANERKLLFVQVQDKLNSIFSSS